jgi:hypothetical protein
MEDKSAIKRGTKVYFHGRIGISDLLTYVWSANRSTVFVDEYIIEHPQGKPAEEFFSPIKDGFEAPFRKELDINKKYLSVIAEEINIPKE